MAWSISKAFTNLFSGARQIEPLDWENLEDTLLQADFGPRVTDEVIESVHAIADASATLDTDDLRRILGEVLEERLAAFDPTVSLASEPGKPAVVLVVGVNGVGKTTTIGKFAKFITTRGKRVLVGAADTFRAAAVEQLATWAERAGVDIVKPQQDGQDPAAVAFETTKSGIDEGAQVILIDTAGRLQTKQPLKWLWHRTKAVFKLGPEFFDRCDIYSRGNPAVDLDLAAFVFHVVRWNECVNRNIDAHWLDVVLLGSL
jgi:fused signal recognition particle receptor